jgi:hypothetical protein
VAEFVVLSVDAAAFAAPVGEVGVLDAEEGSADPPPPWLSAIDRRSTFA